jgi:hypothetical protein
LYGGQLRVNCEAGQKRRSAVGSGVTRQFLVMRKFFHVAGACRGDYFQSPALLFGLRENADKVCGVAMGVCQHDYRPRIAFAIEK